MVLTIYTEYKNGQKSSFVEKILDGSKKHSIREDVDGQWASGLKIQFVTGDSVEDYNQFTSGTCKSIQLIEISRSRGDQMQVKVDGKALCIDEIKLLAANDGFDTLRDLFDFIVPVDTKQALQLQKNSFKGKLIHWTDLKY